MRVRIEDIEAFLVVAELRSFNRAAGKLAITQSALSRRLMKLEETLGSRLLDRTTRTTHLTVVGNEFLPMAERMLRDYEKSLSDIVDIIQIRAGSVTVSSNMTIAESLLPEMLLRFRIDHPDVRVRVLEGSSPRAMERIVRGEAEFGVGQLVRDHDELEFEPVLRDEYVLACHADHPLAARGSVRWKDLDGQTILRLGRTSATWYQMQRALDENGVNVKSDYEVAHLSALLGLVARNLGASVVPRLAVRRRPDLPLVIRPFARPTLDRMLGTARLKGRTLSPAAEALRATVRDVLAAENETRAMQEKS